ncbi:bis(5'-nucleosyl)-tetraphosphatase [Peredibacter starrii]|uniref:Bis(5'-nucleosyl)-tetraphosphatase [asymmetrical] n=1 Tax=Peredibacter starrii TaxID=28202 RepID=A0AAX4HPG2_9BACT|nr:NUDIX domain-containing protein [Peredibacter starrii]WPU65090.1 NUDIX domain-containing protein [Peredibacter starrii]
MNQTHLSAGIIPIRKKKSEWEFLILRAFSYWDFPKGMVEAEENAQVAAVRELEEETGISHIEFVQGKKFIETEVYGKGKVARYYLAEVKEEVEIKFVPNPITGVIEHHEYRWVSYEEARLLLVPRVQRVLDWAQKLIAN